MCYSLNEALIKLTCHTHAGAVIRSPSHVIYFPGQDPVQINCEISQGSTGWSVNGLPAVSLSGVDGGGIPGHSRNGTSLVVDTPVNNTEYVCVSIRDQGNVESDPVFLFIAGDFIL